MEFINYFFVLSFSFLLTNALPKQENPGVTCPSPLAPQNGYIKGDQYTVGSEITFMCNTGYFRKGYPMAFCKDDGKWTKSNVNCTARSCGDPGTPVNGRRIGMVFQYNHTVRFSCDEGYLLHGPPLRTCQDNQTWSDSQPHCKPISCGKPPNVPQAKMLLYGDGGFVFGNQVEYVCEPGYKRKGDEGVYCGHDGIWHGNQPVCKEVRCPQPKILLNGNVKMDNNTEGAVMQYTCNPGYTLFGRHWRKCLKSGRWTGFEPTCFECAGVGTQVFIRKPFYFKHGVIKSKSGNQVTVSYKEDAEEDITFIGRGTQHYIIVQDRIPSKKEIFIGSRVLAVNSRLHKYMFATVRLINGELFMVQFDGESYEKKEVPLDEMRTLEPPRFCTTCSDPGNPAFSSREDSLTEFIPGMEVIYTCQYTYKMTGSQIRQCQKNGTWTGTTPRCTVFSCDELDAFPPKHGKRKGNSFTIGSILEFSCDDGYTLVGQSQLTCKKSGKWTHPAPTCRNVCENFTCTTVGQKCQYVRDVGPQCVCREDEDCPSLYEPVCGSDGEDYNSHCLMSARACRSGKKIRMVDEGGCLPGGLCQIVPYSVCRGYFPRYFYNSTRKQCQYFIAGGCHPSGWNGFETEEKCNQTCLEGNICKQRVSSGPCTLNISRWAFDSSTGRCRKFNYGGCFGNENNFLSQEQCLQRCGSKKVGARESCPTCVQVKLRQACQDSVFAILARVISVLPNDEEKNLHRFHIKIYRVFKDAFHNVTKENSIVSVPYQSPKCSCLRIPKNKKFVLIGRVKTDVTADQKTGLILNPQSFSAGWSRKIRKQIQQKCYKQLTMPSDIL